MIGAQKPKSKNDATEQARRYSPLFNRKDCCGVYIMDENRLNKPYNNVFTHVLQYIVPHPYFQFFAR